jgi:hypothetical protein
MADPIEVSIVDKTETAVRGRAPCGKCGTVGEAPLLKGTKEPCDNCDGSWYQGAPGAECQRCCNPFRWFHVPPLDSASCVPQDRTYDRRRPIGCRVKRMLERALSRFAKEDAGDD